MTNKTQLIEHMLILTRGDWLDAALKPEVKRTLSPLLIGSYLASLYHKPFNKKAVLREIGAEHALTGMRYVRMACELGLLTERADEKDGRSCNLIPTIFLIRAIEKQINALKAAQ